MAAGDGSLESRRPSFREETKQGADWRRAPPLISAARHVERDTIAVWRKFFAEALQADL